MKAFHSWSGAELVAETDEEAALLKKVWDGIPDGERGEAGWTFDTEFSFRYPKAKAILGVCCS
jgi:hypothetical protein